MIKWEKNPLSLAATGVPTAGYVGRCDEPGCEECLLLTGDQASAFALAVKHGWKIVHDGDGSDAAVFCQEHAKDNALTRVLSKTVGERVVEELSTQEGRDEFNRGIREAILRGRVAEMVQEGCIVPNCTVHIDGDDPLTLVDNARRAGWDVREDPCGGHLFTCPEHSKASPPEAPRFVVHYGTLTENACNHGHGGVVTQQKNIVTCPECLAALSKPETVDAQSLRGMFQMPGMQFDVELVETVNHPAHYGGDTTYEVIKVLEAWGLDDSFCLGNTVKYVARAGKKGDALEDLRKARWYLDRAIKREEQRRAEEEG